MSGLHNTLFLGKVLIDAGPVDSTNRFLHSLATKTKPQEGLIVISDDQQAGRGQFGNKWLSEAGKNLTFSILLKPSFLMPIDSFLLSQAIALGLRTGLGQLLDEQVWIKWPNDIIVSSLGSGFKKISGVLIENTIGQGRLNCSVVGIGVNVNQESFGDELPYASSLKILTGRDYDIRKVLETIAKHIETRYLQLKGGKQPEIRKDYLQELFGYGIELDYVRADEQFKAKIVDVRRDGYLILDRDGVRVAYPFKGVEVVNKN